MPTPRDIIRRLNGAGGETEGSDAAQQPTDEAPTAPQDTAPTEPGETTLEELPSEDPQQQQEPVPDTIDLGGEVQDQQTTDIRGQETAKNIGPNTDVSGPDIAKAVGDQPLETAGALAAGAAVTPVPVDDAAAAPVILTLGGIAAANELQKRQGELPIVDDPIFDQPEKPATGQGIRESELPVTGTPGVDRPEVPVTGEKGPTGGSELPAEGSPVFDDPELPVSGGTRGATTTTTGEESVVPGEFPLAGRDFAARPDQEFVPGRRGTPTASTQQTGQVVPDQSVGETTGTEQNPFRQPTGADRDELEEILSGGGTLGEISERQEQFLRREFPTGEDAVVGRGSETATAEQQQRLTEAAEPFLQQGAGTGGQTDPLPPGAAERQEQATAPFTEQTQRTLDAVDTQTEAEQAMDQATGFELGTLPATDTAQATQQQTATEQAAATATPTANPTGTGTGTGTGNPTAPGGGGGGTPTTPPRPPQDSGDDDDDPERFGFLFDEEQFTVPIAGGFDVLAGDSGGDGA